MIGLNEKEKIQWRLHQIGEELQTNGDRELLLNEQRELIIALRKMEAEDEASSPTISAVSSSLRPERRFNLDDRDGFGPRFGSRSQERLVARIQRYSNKNGRPKRPLSAYNMFFKIQRERIVAGKTGDPTPEEIHESVIKLLTSKTPPKRRLERISHGIRFGDLAKTIAEKWEAIDPKLKAIYDHYADQEKVRYKNEVVIWKEKKEQEHHAAIAAKQRMDQQLALQLALAREDEELDAAALQSNGDSSSSPEPTDRILTRCNLDRVKQPPMRPSKKDVTTPTLEFFIKAEEDLYGRPCGKANNNDLEKQEKIPKVPKGNKFPVVMHKMQSFAYLFLRYAKYKELNAEDLEYYVVTGPRYIDRRILKSDDKVESMNLKSGDTIMVRHKFECKGYFTTKNDGLSSGEKEASKAGNTKGSKAGSTLNPPKKDAVLITNFLDRIDRGKYLLASSAGKKGTRRYRSVLFVCVILVCSIPNIFFSNVSFNGEKVGRMTMAALFVATMIGMLLWLVTGHRTNH